MMPIAGPSRLALRAITRRTLHSSARAASTGPSPLEVRLRDGLKSAMKNKDRQAATCLKSVLADVTNAAKAGPDPSAPAAEASVIKALRKGIEQRREASQSYAPGSSSTHQEQYTALIYEMSLLQNYLPQAPEGDVLKGLIHGVVDALPQEVKESRSAMGAAMKAVIDALGDAAAAVDRKEVSKIVAEALKAK